MLEGRCCKAKNTINHFFRNSSCHGLKIQFICCLATFWETFSFQALILGIFSSINTWEQIMLIKRCQNLWITIVYLLSWLLCVDTELVCPLSKLQFFFSLLIHRSVLNVLRKTLLWKWLETEWVKKQPMSKENYCSRPLQKLQ